MIFATVGTIVFPRLVVGVDKWSKTTKEEVVIQGADKSFSSESAKYFDYTNDINQYIEQARIIISHCGVGTVYKILQAKKPAIIVPRRSNLGEHYDDHQYEMAQKMRGTLPFYFLDDIAELDSAINSCEKVFLEKEYKSTRHEFIKSVRRDIVSLLRL